MVTLHIAALTTLGNDFVFGFIQAVDGEKVGGYSIFLWFYGWCCSSSIMFVSYSVFCYLNSSIAVLIQVLLS